ncbi:MAG: pantetheine-phosphate adenylyltransferase [Candidatus Cloacimonadota bacterium]|nr:pantetheine-phosphate adenylyltransferase [Candidatus Cloacimonadota bacterium]
MHDIAIYPGTFDPITNGHVDIIERGSKMFGKIVVAVAEQTAKSCLFTADERVEMAKIATKHIKNVIIEKFTGLAVEYVKNQNGAVMLRGLRAVSDFEYELQMALANRELCENVETVFLTPKSKYLYLSSSLVKQIISAGGDVQQWAHEKVIEKLKTKLAFDK